MERRLQGLWAWLPTFRAVAEEEHVSRAAEAIGVSPSAVSRMLGLVEAEVGQPLFNRVGRSVKLNAAGRQLLEGVRNAMRMVDESLRRVDGTELVGPVRIASAEPVTRAFLMPALAELRVRHPELVPDVRVAREADVPQLLLQGQLDVAFVRLPIAREQLSILRLGELGVSVYAARGHPLYGVTRCRIADAVAHPFVTIGAEQSPGGAWWPVAYRRKVAISVEALDFAAELCATGELLAVLPDVVAERYRRDWGADLHRLPLNVVRSAEVFAVWREQLELPGRADAVVEAVRRRFAQ
ncbi:MAG TPA: LysR family transcriptional regulator [Polyangiaceae bacterium]|jgi:DNA-binding transcriptional LysR family regulator|nr:LysR family transcriptional regulator [Polyangiaceae bacterium]